MTVLLCIVYMYRGVYRKSNLYCMWLDWLVVLSLNREFITHMEISPIAMTFKHILYFMRKDRVLYRANSYIDIGIFTVYKVCQKEQLYCRRQVLHRNVLAGNLTNCLPLTHVTWKQNHQYTLYSCNPFL